MINKPECKFIKDTEPLAASAVNAFVIPHPGTGELIKNLTFDEAMEKWFEGFNIPRRIMNNGEEEPFSASYKRVHDYFNADEV